jgi:hypothetical protein
MIKAGIDQDAIVKMFSEATAKQGELLRKVVSESVLKALQGRELTTANIKKVIGIVTTSATAGAAKNISSPVDVEAILTKAFTGMDGALLKAVEANRKALQHLVDQGAGLQEKQIKGALANVEKMEATFFAAVTKAAQGAGGSMQAPWEHVLDAMKMKGTDTGTQAAHTVEHLMAQTRQTLREGRATTVKTAQAMLDGYGALVSGVLLGMSEAAEALPGQAGMRGAVRSRER